MAQKTQVVITDDVDGGPADETVLFTVGGVTYEIDLSAAHVEAFNDSMREWVDAARKVGGRGVKRPVAGVRPVRAASDAGAVRAWARDHGFEVNGRGRVSGEIRAAYEAAHA